MLADIMETQTVCIVYEFEMHSVGIHIRIYFQSAFLFYFQSQCVFVSGLKNDTLYNLKNIALN